MTVKTDHNGLELKRIGRRRWQVWHDGELVADDLSYELVRPLMLGRVTVDDLLEKLNSGPQTG